MCVVLRGQSSINYTRILLTSITANMRDLAERQIRLTFKIVSNISKQINTTISKEIKRLRFLNDRDLRN